MPAERFVDALNEQVSEEFAASHQYLAMAVHYEAETLPRLAGFFYQQAVEEREHALMMIKYLVDTQAPIRLAEVKGPKTEFADFVQPIRLALEQDDFLSEQFMQWFLKEQVEEEATMSELLDVAERSRDQPMIVEEFLARENFGAAPADPTAPPIAGA
jgi:ferritin